VEGRNGKGAASGGSSSSAPAVSASSPFLFTSQEFVGKMVDRGFEVDLELRNQLYMLSSAYAPAEHGTASRFWKECSFERIHTARCHQRLRRLLIFFSVLEKYRVNYINLVVLFLSMTPQQQRNLYRHYYLEWVKRGSRSSEASSIEWLHTPREFSGLGGDAQETAWFYIIEQFVCSEHFVRVVFFINQFYTYMAPFV